MRLFRSITWFHSFYFLITGLWPIFHIDSFMLVTGFKVDQWLVKMVGLLAASIGGGSLSASIRNDFNLPLLLVLLASSISFLSVDVFYSLNDRISDIYLLDTIPQLIFISAYAWRIWQTTAKKN